MAYRGDAAEGHSGVDVGLELPLGLREFRFRVWTKGGVGVRAWAGLTISPWISAPTFPRISLTKAPGPSEEGLGRASLGRGAGPGPRVRGGVHPQHTRVPGTGPAPRKAFDLHFESSSLP